MTIKVNPCLNPAFSFPMPFLPPPCRSSRIAASTVDFQPDLGKDKDKLAEVIGEYDGLAVRSATKVTAKILERAKNLKVIGRAGIGVDNVEIPAATARGVIVMNTPFGNSITTAEHAIAMMFALARQIPQADASTQAGKWEKNRFMGVELTGKVLGIIGCGNIGSIVADRAIGLRMRVIAYDPFLSPERALETRRGKGRARRPSAPRRHHHAARADDGEDEERPVGGKHRQDEEGRAHHQLRPRRPRRRDRLCAQALDSGHVAGAAFDVFSEEPATANPLFGHPNVVCTPHLGAATTEAQENVALQIAEQMSDYLLQGAIQNAVNFPSITAEEAPRLRPFVALAEKLGSFIGQLTEAPIKGIRIEYEGAVAEMNTRALTSAAVTGVLRPFLQDINMVSAPLVARERGIMVEEVKRENAVRDYESFVRIIVDAEDMPRHAGGTVFQDGKPRVIEIRNIAVDAEFAPNMIYVRNDDKPGFIGRFGTLLGEAGVNVATFALGRDRPGGDAICFVSVDQPVSAELLRADRGDPASQARTRRAVLKDTTDACAGRAGIADACRPRPSTTRQARCRRARAQDPPRDRRRRVRRGAGPQELIRRRARD